jgi:PAS domain S-box-containing protein
MMQTKISSWLSNLNRTKRFFLNLSLILFIAWLDQITPAEFNMRLFYLIPIFISVWYGKEINTGIFFSIISTFLYYYIDGLRGVYNLHGFYLIWELMIVCSFYILIVVIIHQINKDKVALKQSENKFRSLFDNSEVGMFITRMDGSEILDFNDKYLKIINYTLEEIVGKPSVNMWADKRERDEMVKMLRADGHVTDFEFDLLNKQGEVRRCITSLQSYPDTGILEGSLQDITERKQAELIIQQQNNQLLELNATKDKFFSIIAHDLKSPFHGFLGLTQEIIKSASNISVQELTQLGSAMYQSADNLFRLLQNLLEWALMQSGSASIALKDILLTNMIAENIEAIKVRSELKGILLNNLVIDQIHAYVDEKMLNSVLLNLLSNAVKFTQRNGAITVSAKETVDQMIKISVKDTGMGMPKSMVEKLFILGEKTSRQGTDGELSTGLGLLLCKEFIDKNGGKIWVESEEGTGSTFYFTVLGSKYSSQ